MATERALCAGADGCRAGWIVATARSLRERPRFHLFPDFASLAADVLARCAVLGVDMPIGLADAPRRCDREARALLGPGRASSVFPPPSRAALAGTTAAEVRARNLAATGRSLSEQALNILARIREVDEAITPTSQARIREVHPEVVFASRSADGRGLRAPKRSAAGRAARLALLPSAFARAAPTAASRPFPAARVALDDYVDALAVLLAAIRVARGEARRLPADGEERDARGLVMEIVY